MKATKHNQTRCIVNREWLGAGRYELLQREGIGKKHSDEYIFRQGNTDTSLYFIQSKLLKPYYLSGDGKVSIKPFLVEKDFIGSLSSAYTGGVYSFSLQCLEPSLLSKIPFEILHEYRNKDANIVNEMIDVLLKFPMKNEKMSFYA